MLTRRGKSGTALRRLTAFVVAAWLTGAGCLLCCSDPAKAAGHDPAHASESGHARAAVVFDADRTAAARAASNAAAPAHSCCKARVPGLGGEPETPARETGRVRSGPPAHDVTDDVTGDVTDDVVGDEAASGATPSSEVSEAAEAGEPRESGGSVGFPERPSGARGCCERASQTLEAARKPRREPAQPPVSDLARHSAAEVTPARVYGPPPTRRARPPDRGDARLLACIFRI
ncbi:MAG TPA: hypothetical protein VEY09_14585 [Pyrinomonadaceae bacterium]|nr:hypothetical protein [Pyrinomonadaceae bacterium]